MTDEVIEESRREVSRAVKPLVLELEKAEARMGRLYAALAALYTVCHEVDRIDPYLLPPRGYVAAMSDAAALLAELRSGL